MRCHHPSASDVAATTVHRNMQSCTPRGRSSRGAPACSRGTQRGCPRKGEARAVDHGLRVLDAEADGESLRLDEHARRCSIRNVSRALCPSANTTCGCGSLAAAQFTPRPGVLDQQVGDPALEADLAAEREDLLAHRGDDPVRRKSDVRLADVQDLGRRAGPYELLHHLAAVEPGVLIWL